jgi:hypothetical protein
MRKKRRATGRSYGVTDITTKCAMVREWFRRQKGLVDLRAEILRRWPSLGEGDIARVEQEAMRPTGGRSAHG